MLLELIATTPPDSGFTAEQVAALVIAIIVSLGGGGILGKKISDAKRITVDPQPLSVKMEDHFVTRREFDTFKGEIRNDVTEMKGLFRETQALIREIQQALSKDIRDMGTGAYNGRQKIWEKVNDQGERLKSVEDRMPLLKKPGT